MPRTVQQPGVNVATAEDLAALTVPTSGNVPVTGHGGSAAVDGELPVIDRGETVDGTMGDTYIVDTGGDGLRPRLLSSVDPNGMPTPPVLNGD